MIQVNKRRYHHLDAVRAFAMLLGIVLHGLLSFMTVPIWPAQDIHQNTPLYGFIVHALHGFRLPLFFMISGFFTAMLWRRRGLRDLIKHRAKRILLPLVIGTMVLWPMFLGLGIWGGATKARILEQRVARSESGDGESPTVAAAARVGTPEQIRSLLAEGADVNARDDLGVTPLGWAALRGHTETMELLLGHGADPDGRNQDGATPLHCAAFLGRTDAARLLVEHGADVNARNQRGERPADVTEVDWPTVLFIAGILELRLDEARVKAGRPEVAAYLKTVASGPTDNPADRESPAWELPGWVRGVVAGFYLAAVIPVFHHLWFLYYLLWLVAGFVAVAALKQSLQLGPLPPWMSTLPYCWLWLVPLSLLPQLFMLQTFGADTAAGILPWPPKLLYYAVFFAFGALCFGKPGFEEQSGRRWPLYFLAAIPILLVGLHAVEERPTNFLVFHSVASLCGVLYAWLMSFGCIGVFRRVFSTENRRIRYISDSAYWLYIAHLPLIMALQILVSDWPYPSFVKFLVLVTVCTGFLLVVYEYAVRYTIVGTVLNGKRVRQREGRIE